MKLFRIFAKRYCLLTNFHRKNDKPYIIEFNQIIHKQVDAIRKTNAVKKKRQTFLKMKIQNSAQNQR